MLLCSRDQHQLNAEVDRIRRRIQAYEQVLGSVGKHWFQNVSTIAACTHAVSWLARCCKQCIWLGHYWQAALWPQIGVID